MAFLRDSINIGLLALIKIYYSLSEYILTGKKLCSETKGL